MTHRLEKEQLTGQVKKEEVLFLYMHLEAFEKQFQQMKLNVLQEFIEDWPVKIY